MAILHSGDGDAKLGDTVNEIPGAVDGINDPPDALIVLGGVFEEVGVVAFFADETVAGVVFGDRVDDDLLALAVDFGDDLVTEFVFDFRFAQGCMSMAACFSGGLLGDGLEFFVVHSSIVAGMCGFVKWGDGEPGG